MDILNIEDKMQYLISNEFDKKSTENVYYMKGRNIVLTCTCTCYMPKQIIFYTENSIFEDSKGFKIENNSFVLKEFAICDMKESIKLHFFTIIQRRPVVTKG
ncbi:hypothetical protein V1478_016920 [Vespula squamosa]|uniref:Uncharacterized protein n=1 Tax=Vespula squamosa TaxID=30214 RepID=A0ABD1ZXW4_VESSQ